MRLSLQSQFQIYLGLFEKELHPWLKRLSEGITTAIDIGAAYGEYTLYILLKTKASKVYAFEPDSYCAEEFKANLSLNPVDSARIEFSSAFVGDTDTTQQTSLDTLSQYVRTPCLIKMDVDGAEANILKAATRLNQLPGIRWIIETHSKELEQACLAILKSAGFEIRIIRKAWWRFFLPELRPREHNQWLVAWRS